MSQAKIYKIPDPVISKKEEVSLDRVNDRYKKLITPGMIGKVGNKAKEIVRKRLIRDTSKYIKKRGDGTVISVQSPRSLHLQ